MSVAFDPRERAHLRVVGADVPARGQAEARCGRADWIELLWCGLTFDLEGIGPAPGPDWPTIDHAFDFAGKSASPQFEAMRLVPGPHLAGGERTLPVVRSLIGLARDMTECFDAIEAVVWPPSRSVIGRRFFESTTTAWLDGGAFPALGLTAFRECFDGALQSVGLDYFIGQELRIEPSLSSDRVAATRLGIRLVNQLVIMGALSHPEHVIAPDGSRLVMTPSSNGRFVRVQSE